MVQFFLRSSQHWTRDVLFVDVFLVSYNARRAIPKAKGIMQVYLRLANLSSIQPKLIALIDLVSILCWREGRLN